MRHHIAQEIVDLNLPQIERVVVLGGAVMELAGMRPARDIDLATNHTNTDYLFESEPERWRKKVNTFHRISDSTPFTRTSVEDIDGRFDIWYQWYHAGRPQGSREIYLKELIDNSWQHEAGFHVVHFELLISIKKAAGRTRDKEDVKRYFQFIGQGY